MAPDETDPVAIAAAVAAGSPHAAEFTADVAESTWNLALSRAGARAVWPDIKGNVFEWVLGRPDPLVFFEQSIVDGHPRHPLKRTRRGMSPAEQVAYAPEHRPVVDLVWIPMRRDRVEADGWPFRDGKRLLVPLHPWQYEHVAAELDLPAPAEARFPAHPLMSLRTFALPWRRHTHVKTAIGVQMTSAVRTVSPASLHNGRVMRVFQRRTEAFHMLSEHGHISVLDDDGKPQKALSAIARHAPVARYIPMFGYGRVPIPMGALTTPTPHHRSFLTEAVELSGLGPAEWWNRLLAVLLPEPLFRASTGLGLEAHGQNLILVLRGGIPVEVRYRDFGGIRVHTRFRPDLRFEGDLRTDDIGEVHRTLLGSLFGTVLLDLAEDLTTTYDLPAATLWRAVAAAVERADPTVTLRDALYADTLPVKALTSMRLATDQLDPLWASVPNPLAAHR